MHIRSTPQVDQFLQNLVRTRPTDFNEVQSLQSFLEQHRHGADYPEVLSPIRQSQHFPLMGEVRASDPYPPYRILFIMDPAETQLMYLVAGNKGAGPHQGNDWYDVWVPVADRFIDIYWTNQTQ